jgi:serine/threonine protein kinase, bacterial
VDEVAFGRYRLIEPLGRGGMGEVWRAHDTAIDRIVALKRLLPHFTEDQAYEQRFRREARAAARLDDPHVVPIYDVGEIDGRLYVTMRLIKGRDLQTLLDSGPLEPQRAVGIVGQVAAALRAAHKDLIDFGIARATGETGITSTGSTIGTWAYMAPERFKTGTADARADVYALTCVLYQCLTTNPPFPNRNLEQIAAAHMFLPPPKPSTLQHSLSAEMDQVIATGMAKGARPALRHDNGSRRRCSLRLGRKNIVQSPLKTKEHQEVLATVAQSRGNR